MKVKVVELMHKYEEQELLITSMEKEVNEILKLITSKNFVPNDTVRIDGLNKRGGG